MKRIKITWDGQNLKLFADTEYLGSQYDDYAQQLVFARPEEYRNDDLILLFSNGDISFEPINIGKENNFTIPDTLTQKKILKLETAFKRDGNFLIHSNILHFLLRESLQQGNNPASSLPSVTDEFLSSVFAGADYQDDTLAFYTMSGIRAAAVMIEGFDKNYVDAGDAAAIAAAIENGDATEQRLRDYADAGDASTLTAVKEHCDAIEEKLKATEKNISAQLTGAGQITFTVEKNRIESITVYGQTTQAGSGDPSPDNVRPISGLENPVVRVSGRNLCPKLPSKSICGIAFDVAQDGTVTASGTATSLAAIDVQLQPPLPAGTYTLSANNPAAIGSSDATSPTLTARNSANTYIAVARCDTVNRSIAFTATEPIHYVRLTISTGITVNNFIVKPQLELDSAATPYEPYNGDAYVLSTAGSLYGQNDVFDKSSSDGTEIRRFGIMAFDGTESWVRRSTNDANRHRMVIPAPNIKLTYDAYSKIGIICSHYKEAPPMETWLLTTGIGNNGNVSEIMIYDSRHNTTAEDFKAWLAAQYAAGTPVTVVFPLEAPVTTTNSPVLIENPSGEVVVSGPGNMTVTMARMATTRDLQGFKLEIINALREI